MLLTLMWRLSMNCLFFFFSIGKAFILIGFFDGPRGQSLQWLIVRCAVWLFLLPMKGLSLDWHNDQLTDWFNIWLAVTINRFRTYWKLKFDWTYTRLIEWLAHWLTDFITDWLIDQLTVWTTDKPFDWLTDWLINQLTVWMTDKPTDWLTDLLINQLTVWMTDKPIESLTYLWNRSCIW